MALMNIFIQQESQNRLDGSNYFYLVKYCITGEDRTVEDCFVLVTGSVMKYKLCSKTFHI